MRGLVAHGGEEGGAPPVKGGCRKVGLGLVGGAAACLLAAEALRDGRLRPDLRPPRSRGCYV